MIPSVLQDARRRQNLSLGALADRSGVNKATLSRWEAGKSHPRAHELERVLEALTVPEETRRACFRHLGTPRATRRLQATTDAAQTLPISGGELLRTLRTRAGVTQTEAASAVGVTQSLLSRWESDDCWPEPESLRRLCRVLGGTAGEERGLIGREWSAHEELPLDRDALDAAREQLEKQDTLFERDLHYLALAGRYRTLCRQNRISESDALAVWGYYGNYLSWSGRFDDLLRLTKPVVDNIKQTSGFLTKGQRMALFATGDALTVQPGRERSVEIVLAAEDRIAPADRSSWLDELSQKAERCGLWGQATDFLKQSVGAAQTLPEKHLRQQRFAALLCKRKRYREALDQLESLPAWTSGDRLRTRIYRDLVTAWALTHLGEKREAVAYLDRALPTLKTHPFPSLIGFTRQFTDSLVA